MNDTLMVTEADIARWHTQARASQPHRITDGPYQPTGFGYMTWADRPSLMQAIFGGHNWVSVTRERWGWKRYERWFDAEGREMGRWWWVPEERFRPSGSPPLPQTCTRDTLEDEMGYEAATAYIGHQPAIIGIPLEPSTA